MMSIWSELIKALGQDENGTVVMDLRWKIQEPPTISETPDSYNDPDGKTVFYKFIKSGLEFGFRSGRLNHVHFFVQPHEGYSAYRADVLGRVAQAWTLQDVVRELGPANKGAPARVDMLIGKVQRWSKYEFVAHDLRMEFSEDGHLWKVTIVAKF
ncbi:hypothetical protein [Pseudomonas sp. McL0111]|uniref:hypothetical protein n=1 Tax=Pseudomonas sp. McL0111 TaxID=3457357 RepID=UPI00403E3EAB